MRILKTIFMLAIFIVLAIFCTKNASAVVVDLLYTKIDTQLYMVMLVALILGAFLVGFVSFADHARLKRQLRRLRKQCYELQNKVNKMEGSREVSSRESLPSPQEKGDS
ncbi:MAG: LapA family protein [Deltaproteobacteria bacterium]|nr:LapA family protein [Deltaproteobacteria bacterium]MBW2307843.1 LapA family protein [Deltaproteobacteria bacterium]